MLRDFIQRLLPQGWDPPPGKRTNTASTSTDQAYELPDNVKYVPSAKAYMSVQHEPNGATYKVEHSRTNYGQRTPILSVQENNFFATDKRFTVQKAIELKPHWADGMTAKETASYYTGQRGYSQETIKGYFASFNKFLAPLESSGGGAASTVGVNEGK